MKSPRTFATQHQNDYKVHADHAVDTNLNDDILALPEQLTWLQNYAICNTRTNLTQGQESIKSAWGPSARCLDHGKHIKSVLGIRQASAGSEIHCIAKNVCRREEYILKFTLRGEAELDCNITLMYQLVFN